ncbi:MAG TPA: fumarylacetoacetate hydrolase family protein [Baekduia sp.]|nr:fumarylacetoacetate hydrolase family protein [Baekduia sp.]
MRLVTFRAPSGPPHVGRLDGDGDDVRVVELAAASMLHWLRGEGHAPVGRDHALADVTLLAPLSDPPSVRDFFAFEGHVATGWRLRGGEIPEAWYEAPVFYFSNPASIHGPGQPVRRPAGCERLDFELEIAAVIGEDGEVAAFTLLNDWSARDIQRREMTIGLGPAKGKDFATSLGPWLVTPDELPLEDGRLQLTATASIDGVEVTRTHAGEQHWTWPQLVAHAGRETRLRPGDILGSGTLNRGCLLELNADGGVDGGERWLRPGDTVSIEAEGLGRLEAPIV